MGLVGLGFRAVFGVSAIGHLPKAVLHIYAVVFARFWVCRTEKSSKKRLRRRLVKFGLSRCGGLGAFLACRGWAFGLGFCDKFTFG